jgi:hypothetical protein
MDLFTSGSTTAGNHLFRNNGDSTKHWIEIDLVGTTANKSGVGAQIEVYAGTLRMMREVSTAVGYRSQNMMTAHFGLGTATTVDSIVVRWPDTSAARRRSVMRNVTVNRRITIAQPPVVSVGEEVIPLTYWLEQNYPNPFNPSTRISFSVRGSGFVSLKVYDVLGREVRTLVNEDLQPGSYEVTFNADGLASGVYLYRLRAGTFTQTKRMVLLR